MFGKPQSHFIFCISSDDSAGKAAVRCQLKAHNEVDCLSGGNISPVIAQGPVLSTYMPSKALWLSGQVLWLYSFAR